ncbi:MAG: ATP-binding protein [Firmicutes bacterium]|nr:ATP-binding protein [Bacillota bacterium]
MYLKRHIEKIVYERAKTYQTVLVTGARQVGKSTLLEHSAAKDIPQFTLDDLTLLASIQRDMQSFLNINKPPIFIDEIQYAPELFRGIKMMIDKRKNDDGLYFMTGSQKFELMQGVSETLSGRIAVLNLLGLSAREIDGDSFDKPFMPTAEFLNERNPVGKLDTIALWKHIHRGFYPKIALKCDMDWESYYADYLKTYVERDVRKLSQVGDLITFVSFMTALAARTGQLLNIASIARDVGVSEPTVKKWISILEASNIIYLLRPFSLNANTRIVKTPKIYFLDTGLASYLCRWLTPDTLRNGAMSGQIFETYAVGEILKSYYNAGKEPPIYFFRNDRAAEIDILFYQDGTIFPVEIKKTANPNPSDITAFKLLETAFPSVAIDGGGLLCTYDKALSLTDKAKIIPINYI